MSRRPQKKTESWTRRVRRNLESRRNRSRYVDHNRDLSDVLRTGAVVRRHRFLADLRVLLLPALISGLVQCAVYSAMILRAGRSDWSNLAMVCGVLMIMPFVTVAALAALRSREYPFSFSALLTVIIFNFGVVVLSALRIPISYSGLLLAAPVAVAAMILAATQLRRGHSERLAILEFPGAEQVAERIGGAIRVIGPNDQEQDGIDAVLIDGVTHHTPAWSDFLIRVQMRGIPIVPWFAVLEQKWGRVSLEHFDLSHLAYTPSQILYTRIKRLLDLFLLVICLPVIAPLGALIALYIRMVDGGPVLFVQTRRGYAGRNFRMLKFRTMRKGTHGGATGKTDDRILPGCRFLRRYRLDELPQLINIFRGEMSWIGPRPVSLEIARKCEKKSLDYAARYLVLPGITGWAQIKFGYAGNTEQELTKLEFDLYYLKRISFDLDLEISFRTIRTLVTGKGGR